MEKRAVQVSHELWQQLMTEGYSSGSIKCIEGLPEDAKFVGAFIRDGFIGDKVELCDPVFVFESDNWEHLATEHTVTAPWGESFPLLTPVFQMAECRTCKYWSREREYSEEGFCSSPVAWVDACIGKGLTLTLEDFGCTRYEKAEDD